MNVKSALIGLTIAVAGTVVGLLIWEKWKSPKKSKTTETPA